MKKSKILKGHLPPEDGSDRRETLGKRVSDDFAKMIFRAEKIVRGDIFFDLFSRLFFKILAGLSKFLISKKLPPGNFVWLGKSFLQNRLKRVSPKFHADRSYPRGVNDLSKVSIFPKNVPPKNFFASEDHFCKTVCNAFPQSFTPIGAILGG